MKVDLEELRRALAFVSTVNHCELSEIEWFDSSGVRDIDQEKVREWKFIGLNNTTFAMTELL
jgi:hypothetical protein